MALSQVQCLDNNNVNWKYSESKPEFFYSEEQRLALEALVAKGTDAFYEVLKKENIRDFLSELEMKRILEGIEPYDPSNSHINGDSAKERDGDSGKERDGDSAKERDGGGGEKEEEEEEGSENSLEYWPMKSDCSIPQLDLGWPDVVVYRGVTRATVYMQPPLDGQPHIKEVVRKMIVQAQKVIAVVMDIFTDVDIFKDMLDAGFKRKVGIYIILDETSVKYFLQMCERAQMHAGHLKNLRVRCTCGTEFYTHSSTMFKGALAQKFMFVDGDRAVCGAYSFTWSAARTDRNIITVLSGQVVESFDKQFQDLYLNSKGVSLKMIPLEDEPEPEPLFQHTAVPIAPDPEVARRLINPKYSLVKTKSASDKCGSKEESKGKAKETKQPFEEMLLNIHPALHNMEKANMFDYLPTWVEPDPEPGSEVLGYINIIDPNIKNPQLSQMNRIKICDTSQAMAQHMMMIKQNKEQEAKQTQQAQVDTRAPPSPTGGRDTPQMPETKRAHKAPESPKPKVSHAQESFRPQAPEVPESPKPKTLEVPESPKPKTPESPAGAFALLADSQHLHHNENKIQDPLKNGQGNQPPVPKPRTVPVADLILKNNVINESQSKNMNKQENKSSINEEENKAPMVNGLHKIPVKPKTPTELKATNRPCAQNGFVENGKGDGNEDDETEDYNTVSDQDSFSDCSSSTNHYKSTASSVSEENYDAQDYYCAIQRRHSELLPNGEAMSLQRQMSEGHISRGTFVSPLKISQSMQEMRQQDQKYMRRNKTLEVEIKRALERSRKQSAVIKAIDRMQSNDSTQRRPFHHFESRAPYRASLDYRDSPGPNSNYRDTSAAVSRFGNAPPAAPAHQHRKSSLPSFLDSQGAPDGMSTPFGIPYSKLSQSKHLKNRLAVHAGDLKRRGLKDQ